MSLAFPRLHSLAPTLVTLPSMSLIPFAPFSLSVCQLFDDPSLLISGSDIAVWTVSALMAIGIGGSRYAKWKTRHKLVRELAAMDPVVREKMLSRLTPKLALEIREELMERFSIMS